MLAVASRRIQLGVLLATALAVSIAPAAGQTYTPEQEQACTGDAFRLCSAEIPDVGRVTACMVGGGRRKEAMASTNGRRARGEDKVRVALIGVGNCANSLLQGVGSALMIPPIYILVTVLASDLTARAT